MEVLQDISDAVWHLCSDEHFTELEAHMKALEEKYKVLVVAYKAEMDRGSDDDEDVMEGGE